MLKDLLFLKSNLSSVVTVVSLSKRSIHRAASEDASSGFEAFSTNETPLGSSTRLSVIGSDLLLPDRKSERTQKNVTV